jgi:Photosynthesis affected mutant 68
MLRLGSFLTAVLLLAEPAAAFHSHARGFGWKKVPRASLFTSGRSGSTRVALAAKKKGFAKPQKQETTSVVSLETVDSTAQESAAQTKGVTSTSTSDLQVGSSSESESMNAGQRALEKMRRERAEQKDQELRKLRELIQTDEQLQEAPAAIPEKVAQRMGKRMLPFVGIPLLGSMGTFVAFWYLRTYKNMDFEPSMVATSTVFFLVVGLLVRREFE